MKPKPEQPCAEELIAAYERGVRQATLESLAPYRRYEGAMAYLGGVSRTFIQDAIAEGRLNPERLGDGLPIFPVKELERFVKADSRKNKQKRKETAWVYVNKS